MSRYTSWLARPRGYRYGSWMTLYGTAGHVVGFSTACWVRSSTTAESRGLWNRCDLHCRQLDQTEVPGWLGATRVLACVGMALSAVWLLIGCPCECIKNKQQHSKRWVRLEEAAAIVAGCFGMLAAMVYGVKFSADVELAGFSISWSFWLHVGGACCATLGGVIVAVTRSPFPSTPKPIARAMIPPCRALSLIPVVPHAANADLAGGGTLAARSARVAPRRSTLPSVFSVFLQTPSAAANVAADSSSPQIWAVPECWTEADRPPPVYSVCGQMAAATAGGNRVPDYSLSPPPPYESCVYNPPPPYEYHQTVRFQIMERR